MTAFLIAYKGQARSIATLKTSLIKGLYFFMIALLCGGYLFIAPTSVSATINQTINFQSKIVDKTTGLNLTVGTPACVKSGADTCDFQIRIWNDQTATSTSSGTGNLLFTQTFQDVEIGDNNGIFNLAINSCGSTQVGNSEWGTTTGTCTVTDDSDADTDPGVNFDRDDLWVEVSLADSDTSGSLGSFSEVFSRQQFRSVPNAFHAQEASTLSGLGAGNFVQLQPTGAQTASDPTNALINLNSTAGTPDLLQLATSGTTRFLVDNAGQTTANRLALWDATPGTDSILKITNATNQQTSGNLDSISVNTVNNSTSGVTRGIYSAVSTGTSNVPGNIWAFRGTADYNSSGTTTANVNSVSGVTNINGGTVSRALGGATTVNVNSGANASVVLGFNGFASNASALMTGYIAGAEISSTNSGTITYGGFGQEGLAVFATNTGTNNGGLIGAYISTANSGGTVNGDHVGLIVRPDNDATSLVTGNRVGIWAFESFAPGAVVDGSDTGLLVNGGQIGGTDNYGIYVTPVTTVGSGITRAIYTEDGDSQFNHGRLGLWNGVPNTSSYLAIDNTTDTQTSGDLYPIDLNLVNDSTGGVTRGVRTIIHTGAGNVPGTISGNRNEVYYDSSATSAGSMYASSNVSFVTAGSLESVNSILSNSTVSSGASVNFQMAYNSTVTNNGTANNERAFNGIVINNVGGTVVSQTGIDIFNFNHGDATNQYTQFLQNNNDGNLTSQLGTYYSTNNGVTSVIAGGSTLLYSSLTNEGSVGGGITTGELAINNTSTGSTLILGGINTNLENDGTVTGGMLGGSNGLYNSSGASVATNMIGFSTILTNDGTASGDIAGITTEINGASQVAGSAYGISVGNVSQGAVNNYGIYIADASGGSGTNAALYVNSGLSRFAPATTGNASINIASSTGTDVSTPNSGDLWWNGTNLYFFNGTTNYDLLSGGGGCGGTCFNQGGNSFGALAVLGTTDNNNLNFIVNGTSAATILASDQSLQLTPTQSGATDTFGLLVTQASNGSAESDGVRTVVTTDTANSPSIINGVRALVNYNTSGHSTSVRGLSSNSQLNDGDINYVFGTTTYVQNNGTQINNNLVALTGEVDNLSSLTTVTGRTSGGSLYTFNGNSGGTATATTGYLDGLVAYSANYDQAIVNQDYNGAYINQENNNVVGNELNGLLIDTYNRINGDVGATYNGINLTMDNDAGSTGVFGDYKGTRVFMNTGNADNIYGASYEFNDNGGIITNNAYGIYVGDVNNIADVNNYGIYITGASGGTGSAALYVNSGLSRFAPATTGTASVNIASSSGTDVSAPNSGDLWWNGTNLYFFNGTTNIDLLSGGGGCGGTCFNQGGNSFGTTGILGTTDSNDLTFIRNSAEVLRVGSGQVSINNSGPQSYATLQVSATSNPVLSLEDIGNGVSYLAQDGSNGTILGAEQNIYFNTGLVFGSGPFASGTNRMFIDGTTGFVGINTTSATQPLTIEATQTGGTAVYPVYVNTLAAGTANAYGVRSVITTDTANNPGGLRALRGEINYNTSGTATGNNVAYGVSSNVQLNDGQIEDARGGNFIVQNNNTEVTGPGGGIMAGASAFAQNFSSLTNVGTLSGISANAFNGINGLYTATTGYLFGYQGDARNDIGGVVNNEFTGLNQIAFNSNVVTGNFNGAHFDVRNFAGSGADGDVGLSMQGLDLFMINDPAATGVFNDFVGLHIDAYDIGNSDNAYGSNILLNSSTGITSADVVGYRFRGTLGTSGQIFGNYYGADLVNTNDGYIDGTLYGINTSQTNSSNGTASNFYGIYNQSANAGYIDGDAAGLYSAITNSNEVANNFYGADISAFNNDLIDSGLGGLRLTVTNNQEVDAETYGITAIITNNNTTYSDVYGQAIEVDNNGTINGSLYGIAVNTGTAGVSTITGDATGIYVGNVALSGNNNYGIYVEGASNGTTNYGVYIAGGDTAQLRIDRNVGTGIEFGPGAAEGSNDITTDDGSLDIAGNVNIGGVCSDSDGGDGGVDGCDVAETFASNDNLQKGEVVKLASNVGEDWKQIARTNSKDDLAVGIISTNPTLIMGNKAFSSDRAYPVGLVGVLPTKVVDQNGLIHRGDYITVSDVAGRAMKANAGDSTIGLAMEDQTSPEDTINILVSRNNQELDRMNELKLANADAGIRVNAQGQIEYRDVGGNWTSLTPTTPAQTTDSNWTASNNNIYNQNTGSVVLGLGTETPVDTKLAISNDAAVVNGIHFLKIAAEGTISIGGYDSETGIRVNPTTQALEFKDKVSTSWTAFTGLLLATTRVDAGTASQVANQEVITGWGYIEGDDAALSLTQTVALSKQFTNIPVVIVTSFGQSDTKPTSLSSCNALSSVTMQGYAATNEDFKLNATRNSPLAKGQFYCYTWTATGTAR